MAKVCYGGFVQPMLCSTSIVQSCVVHLWPVLCTTDHHGAQRTPVENVISTDRWCKWHFFHERYELPPRGCTMWCCQSRTFLPTRSCCLLIELSINSRWRWWATVTTQCIGANLLTSPLCYPLIFGKFAAIRVTVTYVIDQLMQHVVKGKEWGKHWGNMGMLYTVGKGF